MPTDNLPQNQPGAGGDSFTLPERLGDLEVPEKLRGKSAAELLKTYMEGEKAFGQRADYDDIKRKTADYETRLAEYQNALQAWEPWRGVLDQAGWDASKVQQGLTRLQEQARTQAPTLDQWAAEYAQLGPEQQLPFFLQKVIAPLYQAATQQYHQNLMAQLGQVFQQQQAQSQQRERLWFDFLKAVHPDKDIDGIYNTAMKMTEDMTKQGWSPFAAQVKAEATKREQEAKQPSGSLGGSRRTIALETKERPKGKQNIREAAMKAVREQVLSSR